MTTILEVQGEETLPDNLTLDIEQRGEISVKDIEKEAEIVINPEDTEEDIGKKLEKALGFNPYQPNRNYDKVKLEKYFKYSLVEMRNKSWGIIAHLMRTSKLVWVHDNEITTAAMVSTPGRKEIWFNINFVLDEIGVEKNLHFSTSKYTKFTEANSKIGDINMFVVSRLCFLVAHEICHSILGHSHNFYTSKMEDKHTANVAMDSYINHLLYSMNFDASLTESYLKAEHTAWMSPYGVPDQNNHEAVALKNKLVTKPMEVTVVEIYDFLKKQYPEKFKDEPKYYLLGSHGESPKGEKRNADGTPKTPEQKAQEQKESLGELEKALREIYKSSGSSKFGSYFEETLLIEPKRDETLLKALRASAILKGMMPNIKSSLKANDKGEHIELTRNPNPLYMSRTDKMLLGVTGIPKPYYEKKMGSVKTKCVIYLDVSGSMGYMIKQLYGIIDYATKFFQLDVFLFSTTLNPISLTQLKQGHCETTGGTDFNVWVKHLQENPQYKTALVLTDGYDDLTKENMDWLLEYKICLNYLIVDGGRLPQKMREHANKVWDLQIR